MMMHPITSQLKMLRIAQNMSLYRLQQITKINGTHLRNIEKGVTNPTIGMLDKIAKALGVEIIID